MNQVKETIIGFLIGIGIYAVLIETVGIFFSDNVLFYTLGLLFGVVIAVFLMMHMAKTLDYALDLPQEQAVKYTRRQSFLRLAVMLAALLAALVLNWLNFIAVLLGILGLKIGAFIASGLLKILYPEDFVTKLNPDQDTEYDKG